jgi:hypothetical protein
MIHPNDSKCLTSALSQALRQSIIGIDFGSKSTHFVNLQIVPKIVPIFDDKR